MLRSRTRQTRPVGFEDWLAAAGDLLLGARCHGCGQPWWGICPTLSSGARPADGRSSPLRFRGPDGFPMTVTSSAYDHDLAQA